MVRIKVLCAGCRTVLVHYDKRGRGALVKLNPERVLSNPHQCPACHTTFARELFIQGQRFRKLLGGKVTVKGGGITAR
jgi:hypothetical protein